MEFGNKRVTFANIPQKEIIKPGSYNIRLMSDNELAVIADVKFSEKDRISKSHCLDSPMFGAGDSCCSICKKSQCEGHMGLITCPCPIPRSLCTNAIKQLLSVICPKCAHVILGKELKERILTLPHYMRYRQIKDEVDKIMAKENNLILCPVCGKKTTLIEVEGNEPVMRYTIHKDTQINPQAIAMLFNMFTEVELMGWNDDWHPKNFFTTYIPIVPSKLRLKLFDSTTSVLGSYYKSIIEEIITEPSKKELAPIAVRSLLLFDDIDFGILRQRVIYHVGQIVYIDSSGGDISGDEQREFAFFESIDDPQALCL